MESGLISVDRWRNGSQAYFLTHMHSDHTRGLSGDWSQAPLYCSRTTASLFPSRFPGFDLSLLRVVPLSSWTSLSLRSPSSGSTVRLHFMAIDAHHCPGSVMFLFRGDFGCFLYTGDFRWDADAADDARNTLVDAINESPVDILYLDNTYCNPIYSFPSRQVAANLVADIIASHPSHDIIIAVDSLGKEDLLVHVSRILNIKMVVESSSYPIIPGLTDDAAELCLSKIPRSSFQITSQVCRRWKSFLRSKHFAAFRKLTRTVEEFLCVLMESECGRDVYWEVFDASGNKLGQIPPVPGPLKRGFGVAVLDGGKIVFIGGYTEVDGSGINSTTVSASADVYEFDPATNSWKKLADMNIPRYNFAFAEVNGLLYVIRGYSTDTYSLSNAEVYNPETNQWSLMDCPNRPVWRGFAFSFCSKLYAVGNGSRFIDIYDPKTQTWEKLNSEQSVSVYSYTVVRNKVYYMDRNMPGCLGVFDPEENSWSSVFVPRREGGFWVRLGVWNDKVLLFSRVCGHEILMYDLDTEKGSKWRVCDQIKPSASQLTSVLIHF